MIPVQSKSPVGCIGFVLFCFGFLALMAWTGALVGVDSSKARHLAWFVENVIVGTMGRGLGAALTACAGIGLAVAIMVVSGRSPTPRSKPQRQRVTMPVSVEPSTPTSTGQRRRVFGRASVGGDGVSRSVTVSPPDSRETNVIEFDITDADDVSRIMEQRDPALWHEAAMAALAYKGDPHGFLPWVIQQPETDRATAGWIFLWAEGSRYLRGATDFSFNSGVRDAEGLLQSICERSEGMGFPNDALGLDRDFEAERVKSLAAIENGELAPGIVAPIVLLARPFDPPRDDGRFTLDDGLIICEQPE